MHGWQSELAEKYKIMITLETVMFASMRKCSIYDECGKTIAGYSDTF